MSSPSPLPLLLALVAAQDPPPPADAPPAAADEEAPDPDDATSFERSPFAFDREWAFDKKEERRIRKLEREVVEGADGRFRLSETNWKVDTYGSARLAAELGVYLEAFEESVLERFDAKRQFAECPTLKVFASRAAFQEAAPMRSGASLSYEAIPEPKGRSRHRIKILDNHLYTYVEENDDPAFTDLNLPAIRAEAAKAVVIGMVGRPHVAAWFEQGTAEWFRSWDVHAPGKEAFARRSAASPGRAAIVAHLGSARSDWIPPLDRLLRLNENSWEGQPLSSTVSNDAWAEAVIDVLLTDRRAKRLRDELLDELTKEGLSGTGILILQDGLARALEKAWSAHVDSFRDDAKGAGG